MAVLYAMTPDGPVQLGFAGPVGDKGPRGPQGPDGPQGLTGDKGPLGKRGLTGPQGEKGDPGGQGSVGSVGPAGDRGPTGAQGDPGPIGARGATGPAGYTGAQGAQGVPADNWRMATGTVYVPEATADGQYKSTAFSFGMTFVDKPSMICTAATASPGTAVNGVSIDTGLGTSGGLIIVQRNADGYGTYVYWCAWGRVY